MNSEMMDRWVAVGLLHRGSGCQYKQTLRERFHNLQLQSDISCCQRGCCSSSATLNSTSVPLSYATLDTCLTQPQTHSENEDHRKLGVTAHFPWGHASAHGDREQDQPPQQCLVIGLLRPQKLVLFPQKLHICLKADRS